MGPWTARMAAAGWSWSRKGGWEGRRGLAQRDGGAALSCTGMPELLLVALQRGQQQQQECTASHTLRAALLGAQAAARQHLLRGAPFHPRPCEAV